MAEEASPKGRFRQRSHEGWGLLGKGHGTFIKPEMV